MQACSTHAQAVAGWHCVPCGLYLCADCAAGSLQAPACATCGLLVDVLKQPRAVAAPFATTWPQAARSLLTGRGLVQVLVMAIAVQLLLSLGQARWTLGRALEVAWVLFLARRAGVGFDPFGLPRYSDLFSVWLGPLARLLVGAGAVLAGAAVLVDFGDVVAVGLVPWALAAGAVALLPPTLVLASVEGPDARTPWPWRLPGAWRALGADVTPIAGCVAVAALCEVLDARQPHFDMQDTNLFAAILVAFVPRLASFFALGCAGVLAGHLVYTRANELGHHDDALVPVLLTPPRGVHAPKVDLEERERIKAQRFAPIELAMGEDEAVQALVTAIDAQQAGAALLAFNALGGRSTQLNVERALALGQLLAGAGDPARAADVLRDVVARAPVGELQARAMVILARVCAERLQQVDEARALFKAVVARYPGTSAATFAAGRLAGA
jgi:hypothetical protein